MKAKFLKVACAATAVTMAATPVMAIASPKDQKSAFEGEGDPDNNHKKYSGIGYGKKNTHYSGKTNIIGTKECTTEAGNVDWMHTNDGADTRASITIHKPTIKGQDGRDEKMPIKNKVFNIYQLFKMENSEKGESVNYHFVDQYKEAVQNVIFNNMSAEEKKPYDIKRASDVHEYAAIDYIQKLNKHGVQEAHDEQTLNGRYTEFRFFVEDLRNEIEKLKAEHGTVIVKSEPTEALHINGLEYGYYIVDEVSQEGDGLVHTDTGARENNNKHFASSLCMVTNSNPDADVVLKADYPSLKKQIQEDDMDSENEINKGIPKVKVRGKEEEGWNDVADYEIGQTVPFKYDITMPNVNGMESYYMKLHDRMAEELTFNPDSVVITVEGIRNAEKETYTLEPDEFKIIPNDGTLYEGIDGNAEDATKDTFQIEINDMKKIIDEQFDNKHGDQDKDGNVKENVYGQHITVTYNARLNEKAALKTGQEGGFENDVCLEFTNNFDSDGVGQTGYTPWDTVTCFTYRLDGLKRNENDVKLRGAKFRIYLDEECKKEVPVISSTNKDQPGYIVQSNDVLDDGIANVDDNGGAKNVEMVSDEDGNFIIYGLDQGTYYILETDAPAGYRRIEDPIKVEVKPTINAKKRMKYQSGMQEQVLTALEATSSFDVFLGGVFDHRGGELPTTVQDGSMQLVVINNTLKKLPITGSSALVIMLGLGAASLVTASVMRKKEK